MAINIPKIAFEMHCFASVFPDAVAEVIILIAQITIITTARIPAMPITVVNT